MRKMLWEFSRSRTSHKSTSQALGNEANPIRYNQVNSSIVLKLCLVLVHQKHNCRD